MDILMINGTHPATPHISGVRAGRFADELVQLGHRCVLICPPPVGRVIREPAPITDHDWSTPYIIEANNPAPATRGGLATLASLLLHGGRRTGFRRSAVSRGRALAAHFRPQVGWSTFGALEGVVALRTLAKEQGFPWILDIKDNPEIYVPRLTRAPLAWRLRGYSALQANSVLHADAARRWLGRDAEVILSGVAPCFFDTQPAPETGLRYVTLVGSLYRRDLIKAIIGAIADYNAASTKPPIAIAHLGTQAAWLANDRGVVVDAPGYVTPIAMARLCQHSVANLYVFLGRTFHHKLLELLACRRPVIAYGGELPESLALAAGLHAPLHIPATPDALAATLAEIDSPDHVVDPRLPTRFFTWPEQAAMVDAAMRRLVE